MGTLTVKSQSLATQADYADATSRLTINLNYNQDAVNNDLKSINGTIYKTDGMTYAGNFNGQKNGEEMEYSVSGVKSKDMTKVFSAIEDIETLISGENEQE